MKKLFVPAATALAAMVLLSGCLAIGGGDKHVTHNPTLGQQLVDLQKARDAGAISDQEYAAQKAKLLQP
jgi:hypothetical protein